MTNHPITQAMVQPRKFLLLFGMAAALAFASCNNDDDVENPDNTNESEVITTVTMTLTPDGGGTPIVASYVDPDGDGGNPPTIESLALKSSTTYEVSVELLNESVTPPENITEEIKEEAADHQFYYEPAPASLLQVSNLDLDENNLPVGLTATVVSGAAGSGNLLVTLKHKPAGEGVAKAANDPKSKGETDIEINFPVSITN